ncbi:hypothetical protein MXD81_19305, partial [Microbacteriaceae bacterium K1510]|nr:hypothetical protein [Microbacteriaceae bacterium K1510]
EETRRFSESPWLKHLEKNYFQIGKALPAAPARTDEVSLCAAVNRRAEVEAVALQIMSLAREEGYRWRDMAVLLRNIGTYADELAAVLTDYGIPFFLDQKRSVMH